jgi:outer membrane protein assembly factor BamB
MRPRALLAAVGAAATLLATAAGAAPASGTTFVNWSQYLFSSSHASDNQTATTITPANAATLSQHWKFRPPFNGTLGGFLASPTVYNGVIYAGSRNGTFYALNEGTGTVIWSRFIGTITGTTCGPQGFTSTATVMPDPTTGQPTVYVYGPSGYLYAMNAADGTDVFPPAVVAIPSTTTNDYYAWGSPLVFGGNIYVGISSQCDNPLVRGGMKEYSQATGALENTYFSTPAGTVGASIWSSPATDGKSIFVTTGNGKSVSDGLSIVKLSMSLAKEDIWTVPTAQRVFDSDFGGSPTIFTANIGGVPTEMVGACNKNGTYYALNASSLSAGPVWTQTVGNPETVGPGQCDAAAVSDGTELYVASNGTTINNTAYDGSVRALNPATGAIIWQTGLPGSVVGTPGMDGAGVIAATSYFSPQNTNGLFLIDASNGNLLKTVNYGSIKSFAQPVFADNHLFVGSQGAGLREYNVH